MYTFVDWMVCRHCNNTNMLFKTIIDTYQKKLGIKKLRVLGICKTCYLEEQRIKNDKSYSKNKDRILEKAKVQRSKNRKKYNQRAVKYYYKNRIKQLEQKRIKYESQKNNDFITRIKKKQSIRMHIYS